MQLREGDVLWVSHDDSDKYTISLSSANEVFARSSGSGCWCPEEAVEFLGSIGIKVEQITGYSSGYVARGCFWSRDIEPLAPAVQKAYDTFQGTKKVPNKLFKAKLFRYEED